MVFARDTSCARDLKSDDEWKCFAQRSPAPLGSRPIDCWLLACLSAGKDKQSLLADRRPDGAPETFLSQKTMASLTSMIVAFLSGIIFVNRNGLRWHDAPKEYGPAKVLNNRWKRWSGNGVFARIMVGLT